MIKLYSIKNLFLVLFVLGCFSSAAQKDTLSKNKKSKHYSWNGNNKMVSLGIGAPVLDAFYLDREKINATNTSTFSANKDYLVIHVKAEIGLASHIGVAVAVNRSVNEYTETYYTSVNGNKIVNSDRITLKVLTVNLRCNYHFLTSKMLDPYIGIGAGLKKIDINVPAGTVTVFETRKPFGFEATFGLRVLVASTVGIYGEAGIGRSFYQGGITLNFGGFRKRFDRDIL
ncbi:MAG: outer membrane beta-barrel protein [Bacteroidia bacterium]|nr:outer membrane beta-barrel protein [Bacteroidia bacterium]